MSRRPCAKVVPSSSDSNSSQISAMVAPQSRSGVTDEARPREPVMSFYALHDTALRRPLEPGLCATPRTGGVQLPLRRDRLDFLGKE
jgi:hypothetical protein